jgi:hypothetical protein
MLSGFGIDCDVTPFDDAMADAANTANDAANSIIKSTDAMIESGSIDAETNTVEGTETEIK